MLDAISGIDSVVPVTSLKAYIFLSAGTKLPDCDTSDIPISFTWLINLSSLIFVLNPFIDSNLSIVPPVKPSPFPLILAIGTPHAAASGPTTNVVLSPTPPVECLSTLIPFILDKSILSPLSNIIFVKLNISSSLIPFNTIAIKSELIW